MRSHLSLLGIVLVTSLITTGCDNSSTPTDSSLPKNDTNKTSPINNNQSKTEIIYNKSNFGIPWKDSISYLVTRDSRDSQVYRAVKIGNQTWMAENLNYKVNGIDTGLCAVANKDSCAKYGRIYKWNTIMASDSSSHASGVTGICPSGWHIPSIDEWNMLLNFAITDSRIGGSGYLAALKSKSGWYAGVPQTNNSGIDYYGIRLAPTVYVNKLNPGLMGTMGEHGIWWTSSERRASEVYAIYIRYRDSTAQIYGDYAKDWRIPLRCVKNN